MLTFENLNSNHIEDAAQLALSEYHEERSQVLILPNRDYTELLCSMLSEMVDHNLGVAALENNKLVGFLTCYRPWNNHFGTTMGTFSPVHGHGTIAGGREEIYSRLYQRAAEKWAKEGILSHAIALYAHNKSAVNSFFWNGFGLRCIDAIRPIEGENYTQMPDTEFVELPLSSIDCLLPMKNALVKHLENSPTFFPNPLFSLEQFQKQSEKRKSRFFAAKVKGEAAAYIEVMASGENFACDDPKMINICGAYACPEYRGNGLYKNLMFFMLEKLKEEGYMRCGVDFESINPNASGFWNKYFTPYTYSVVRRIDERIYPLLQERQE